MTTTEMEPKPEEMATPPSFDFEVDFLESENLRKDILRHLKEDGVVVVKNVFSSEEAQEKVRGIMGHLHTMCDKLDPDDMSTWITDNLPGGPRFGMYQSLVGNLPAIWDLRTDDRVKKVFKEAYSGLREKEIDSFFTSIDGMTLRPPVKPFHVDDEKKDWAHLDQTSYINDPYNCIQGQIVLSNTSAAFRCSPKSHLLLKTFLKHEKVKENSANWHKFPHKSYSYLRKKVEEIGGAFQIPIHAPAGSMILWLSSVVHSAKIQSEEAPIDTSDPYSGWRCVVYDCLRPKAEALKGHSDRLQRCLRENRMTNHWGRRMFSVKMFRRKDPANILELYESPLKAYSLPGMRPELTPKLCSLVFDDKDVAKAPATFKFEDELQLQQSDNDDNDDDNEPDGDNANATGNPQKKSKAKATQKKKTPTKEKIKTTKDFSKFLKRKTKEKRR
eukprot:m.21913 g.21913  ORF g.21913 m.21913 type:complete len:443 (-) comp8774_c0_seq1:87-1415(-)